MRGDRVLHARADAAEHQGNDQHRKPGAGPGDEIADAGQRGAKAEQQRAADALGERARRHLEPGHRAGEQRAQQPDLGIAEAELGLPQRQQHIEEVGIAVMQHMRAAGDRHCAPLRRGDLAQGRGNHRHRRRLFPFYDRNVQRRINPDAPLLR